MAEMASGSGRNARPEADDDLAILQRVIEGDSQAFEEIVARYKARVYRSIVAITGNAEDAEDAMQDTFLKAYKYLGAFQGASKFSTWLTRIAINEGLQKIRRRRPTVSLDDLTADDKEAIPMQIGAWHENPEKVYSKRELRALVERAIQTLAPGHREVFVMRDVHGLTTEETALVLGISIHNVKSRLLRARLKMRELLAPHLQRRPSLRSKLWEALRKVQGGVKNSMSRESGR